MEIISGGKGHIDIKYEDKIFRLSGDLSDNGFVAWISTIERVFPSTQAPITKQEQLEIVHAVNKYWRDDNCPIYFIDDNYNIVE